MTITKLPSLESASLRRHGTDSARKRAIRPVVLQGYAPPPDGSCLADLDVFLAANRCGCGEIAHADG